MLFITPVILPSNSYPSVAIPSEPLRERSNPLSDGEYWKVILDDFFYQSYHISLHILLAFEELNVIINFFLAEFPNGLLLSLPASRLNPPEEALNDYQLYQ